MTLIRVASIGYGDIAQRARFIELQNLGDRAQLVAIAGRNEEGLKKCAERFGIPDTYTDVDEMLARDDIDAVLVLTPPDVHAEMAIKAIDAGKHVLIEKPMVNSVSEAHAIEEAMKGKQLVCFPLPHVSGTRFDLIKELIAQGAIGEVTSVELHWGHRGPTHADWFYKKALAGGGVLVDLGIYALGATVYLFGPATHVSALLVTKFETRTMDDGTVVEPDVEDDAFVNLWLKNGIAVSLHATWNGYLSHHHTRTPMVCLGREGLIYSAGGAVYVHRADGAYEHITLPSEDAVIDGQPCKAYKPQATQVRGTIEEFIYRIESGDTSTDLLAQQVHVAEIVQEVYASGGLDNVRRLSSGYFRH